MDTFVIRLWSPADHAADAGDTPHGIARHVATGRSAPFRDGVELLALLRDLPRPDAQTDQPSTIQPGDTDR